MNMLKTLISGVALVGATVASLGVYANDQWPQKPIRIVIPFAAGGSVDVIGRELAAGLSQALGKNVYAENKPGGGGALGAQEVARAAPDGYTLLIGNNGTHITVPLLMKNPGYDPQKDFEPIRFLQIQPMFFAMHAKTTVNSINDLREYAKKKGGPITVAAPGEAHRLMITRFMNLTGIPTETITYKGPAPAIADLLGGHVDAAFDTGMSLVPLLQKGQIKVLGIGSPKRSPSFPDIPTIAEQGVPGFVSMGTNSLWAPKGHTKSAGRNSSHRRHQH